ncbi:MAG: hypothetical protein IJ584_11160 [Bacteroidales bacterium]|nr:hypothetical protein [Bacteroidales bacterium]
MFLDCFGRGLVDGEDVIISLGKNSLHCGIVMEISDTDLKIICQYWDGDREYSRWKSFSCEKGATKQLHSVYKIMR